MQLEKGSIPKKNTLMASIFVFMMIVTLSGLLYRIEANTSVLGLNIAPALTSTPIISPTQVPKPRLIDISIAPDPTSKPVYIDQDPITECVSTHPNCNGATIRLKKSQCSSIYCCGIDGKWLLYSSENACKEAANTHFQQNPQQLDTNSQTNNYNSEYNAPYYPPCTIYYPYTNVTQTYEYMTAEECGDLKANLSQTMNDFAPVENTPAPQPQPAYDSSACKSRVTSEYEGLMQSCNQYGGSSAYNACIQIYSEERQNALASCG